ncbi:MAG: hypothetical protein ACRCS9_14635 [Hyphomicrobium sp.]
MKVGDRVRVTKVPADLPAQDQRLQTLFKTCVGKEFEVVSIEDEQIELHVGSAFGKAADYHRIWLPADHVRTVAV